MSTLVNTEDLRTDFEALATLAQLFAENYCCDESDFVDPDRATARMSLAVTRIRRLANSLANDIDGRLIVRGEAVSALWSAE